MGKQTIIRLKDRANVSSIIRRTQALVLVSTFLLACVFAYLQPNTQRWLDKGQVVTSTFKEVPERIKLTSYEGQARAVAPEVVPYKNVYDIRSGPVLLELTGRVIRLYDNPALALPISRKWDGAGEFIDVEALFPDSDKSQYRRIPNKEPEPQPVEPGGDNPVVDNPGGDNPGEDTGGTGGGRTGSSELDNGQGVPLANVPSLDGVPDSAMEDAKAAQAILYEADKIWRTWRDTSDSDVRNNTLRTAQGKYEQARDLLRPWCEQFPNNDPLTDLITYALRGRFDCAKHRTR